MGGGGDLSPSSAPSSPSSSSEPLPHEFAEYAAVSPAIDGESDGCCVCDDPEVEAFLHGGRLQDRSLREAKELIRRYKPGDLVEGVCGTKSGDYVLPDITTFLLVGPRDAGKSALVNRITRVFDKDDDPDAPDRAQVSCNSKSTGTSFLREYRVPRNSNSICIYDTRSLSSNHENNFKMLQRWMTKGLSHGDIITWDNDNYSKIQNIKSMGRQYSFLRCKTRKVNFVIFVVNGASVLESIENNNKNYIDMLHKTFMYPFLSFGALVSEVSQSDSSELSFLSPSLSLLMEVSGIILTFHHSFIWTYHSSIIQQQVRYQLLHPMAHTFLMMWLSTVTF
ncbi:uncharacterized protein LOC127775112 isoform X2 [Oryza glaberrima]|uniref:uncharacterized protein LOC127775112 isoform X2 n=1 Tax=Oryza glaberrima TaxID=4538 RepID=UPI00224C5AEE|nr:uncharacterized protein LOC127775112 isoform X2 [Oryza glaberrima]